MVFHHQEHVTLSCTSPSVIQVELETTSNLTCTDNSSCRSLISPTISDALLTLILDDFPLKRIQWSTSSLSSSTISQMSSGHFSPSGVTVELEFASKVQDHDNTVVLAILEHLMAHRIVIAPLGSISLKRLHRYIVRDAETIRINLPMDGTSFSKEAIVVANGHQCGLLGGAAWSDILLGSRPGIAQSKRAMWVELTKSNNGVTMKQGIQYGKRWDGGASTSLGDLIPTLASSTSSSCPWTSKTRVQTKWPSSLDVKFAVEPVEQETNGDMTTATHAGLPDNLSESFLQLKGEHVSWTNGILGRIDKTIHRPNGVANVGSIITMVRNDDLYPVQVSLFDIIPSYIRLTSMEMSSGIELQQTIESLDDDDSWLLRQDFTLPSQSSAMLTIAYDPVLLPFQRFPPDPNRGMELPPSWARWNTSSTNLYSNSLLLMPPVPDMSMPFNVISLCCTLYVFIIGSVTNQLVQKAENRVYYRLYPDKKPKSRLARIKEKLSKLIPRRGPVVKDDKLDDDKTIVVDEQEKPQLEEKEPSTAPQDDYIPAAGLEQEENPVEYILNQQQRQQLAQQQVLPMTVSSRQWRRLFSLERDGDSFTTFMMKTNKESPTLIVVKTTRGHVFGGFTEHVWERRKDYYGGSIHACLFSFDTSNKKLNVYKWTGANRFVQDVNVDKKRLAMGGGGTGGFGLCLEDDFVRGSTSSCETFENESLCPDEFFEILSVEAYGFVRGTF